MGVTACVHHSPHNCHPVNQNESHTFPISSHFDCRSHFNAYLNELLAVVYVIITFLLVMYIFIKAQGESIYS